MAKTAKDSVCLLNLFKKLICDDTFNKTKNSGTKKCIRYKRVGNPSLILIYTSNTVLIES